MVAHLVSFLVQASASGTPNSLTFFGESQKTSIVTADVFSSGNFSSKTAISKDSRAKTFVMKQTSTPEGELIRVQRSYSDRLGGPALEEVSIYKELQLIRFEYSQKQLGESGVGRIENGKVFYEYTKDGKTRKAEEELESNFVPSDQIYPYLVAHWSELLEKKDVKIRFPVLERVESIGFRFRWDRQEVRREETMEVIRMEPSSVFIRLLVSHIEFFFVSDEKGLHLREISGRTALQVKDGADWKPFVGHVLFGP